MLEQAKEFKPLSFNDYMKLQRRLELELEELLKPAEVIFKQDKNCDVIQVITDYLNLNQTLITSDDKDKYSQLSYNLIMENDYEEYRDTYRQLKEILAKYK